MLAELVNLVCGVNEVPLVPWARAVIVGCKAEREMWEMRAPRVVWVRLDLRERKEARAGKDHLVWTAGMPLLWLDCLLIVLWDRFQSTEAICVCSC